MTGRAVNGLRSRTVFPLGAASLEAGPARRDSLNPKIVLNIYLPPGVKDRMAGYLHPLIHMLAEEFAPAAGKL